MLKHMVSCEFLKTLIILRGCFLYSADFTVSIPGYLFSASIERRESFLRRLIYRHLFLVDRRRRRRVIACKCVQKMLLIKNFYAARVLYTLCIVFACDTIHRLEEEEEGPVPIEEPRVLLTSVHIE
jgi:hypothetical protein